MTPKWRYMGTGGSCDPKVGTGGSGDPQERMWGQENSGVPEEGKGGPKEGWGGETSVSLQRRCGAGGGRGAPQEGPWGCRPCLALRRQQGTMGTMGRARTRDNGAARHNGAQ